MQIIPNIKGGEWQTVHFLKIANWKKKKKTEHTEKCRMGIGNSLRKIYDDLADFRERQALWQIGGKQINVDGCGVSSPSTLSLLLVGGPGFAFVRTASLHAPPSIPAPELGGIQRPRLAYQHLPSPWPQWWLQGCMQTWAPPRTAGQGDCLNRSGHTAGL